MHSACKFGLADVTGEVVNRRNVLGSRRLLLRSSGTSGHVFCAFAIEFLHRLCLPVSEGFCRHFSLLVLLHVLFQSNAGNSQRNIATRSEIKQIIRSAEGGGFDAFNRRLAASCRCLQNKRWAVGLEKRGVPPLRGICRALRAYRCKRPKTLSMGAPCGNSGTSE